MEKCANKLIIFKGGTIWTKILLKLKRFFKKRIGYYYGSNGIEQNIRKALGYFLEARKGGQKEASYYLGLLYMFNEPYVQRNYNKSFKYFEESSNEGFAGGQFYLEECYMNGYGTDIDYDNAITEYKKAGKQNYVPALDRLCDIYKDGMGLEIDLNKAHEYNNSCKMLSSDPMNMIRLTQKHNGIKRALDRQQGRDRC